MANIITGWLVAECNQEALMNELKEKEQLLKLLSDNPLRPVKLDIETILNKYGTPIYGEENKGKQKP